MQSEEVSASFRDRRRNMDSLVYTRDQGTVETVDFTQRTCSEEGEDSLISWKDNGYLFWNSQGLIYIDYLGKMVTMLNYAEILGRFDAVLQ